MSQRLMSQVWNSSLPRLLKWIALYLAYLAHDDGTHIYPSVGRICKRVCLSRRSVQQALAELRRLGIIVALGQSKGGRRRFVNYRMVVSKLPGETANGGKVKTVPPAASFSAETVQPVAPFFPERGTPTAPFDASHPSGNVDSSYNYPSATPKHLSDGLYLSRGSYTTAGGEAPSESFEQGDDFGPGVETDRWLKDTWGKAKPNLRFPITALPDLLAVELRLGNRDFRRAWLGFLADGATGVQYFLRSLEINSRSSGDSRAGFIRAAPNPSTAVPAGTRGSHNRPRRMTENEINQRVLARIKERRATETKKDSQ